MSLFYEKLASNGHMCGISSVKFLFKCSINYRLEYHNLTKVIAARLSTNFTFVLQRIPEWQFLIIFCYTELSFPSHFKSDQTLISSRTSRFTMSSSSQLLEYHDLTKVIAARLLTNFTFVLQQNSELQFLIIFCYTELLFTCHSESDRQCSSIILEQPVRRVQKILFRNIQKKVPRKSNVVAPNLSNISREKCL